VLTLLDSALRQELGLDVVGILGAMSYDQSSNASLTSTYIELHSSVEMMAAKFPDTPKELFSQFCSIIGVSAEDAPSSIIGDIENLCATFANMGLAHFKISILHIIDQRSMPWDGGARDKVGSRCDTV
jgi:hypothetical protein